MTRLLGEPQVGPDPQLRTIAPLKSDRAARCFRFRAPLSAVANDLDMRTMRFGCVAGLIVRLGRHRRSGWRAVSAYAVSEQSADDSQKPLSKNGGAAGPNGPGP